MLSTPKISQSLIKELQKRDHCPKQVYYSFVEGKELIDPSENMLLGRYFETELLGACRGGEKQQAKKIKGGEKAAAYKECDELIKFSKDVFEKLGLNILAGDSQTTLESDTLKSSIDHINKDIHRSDKKAIYDLKWTASKEDDRWNGWADFDSKSDQHIQACHYVLNFFQLYNYYPSFYFLVFGKDRWVRIIKVEITGNALENYKRILADSAATILAYAEQNYKGNGSFNKCIACPFNSNCEDKKTIPEIETFTI